VNNTIKLVFFSLVLIAASIGPIGCDTSSVPGPEDGGGLLDGAIPPDGGNPKQGEEGGPCYPNNTCNEGLVCLSNLCVRLPGPDAGVDSGNDAGVTDARTDAAEADAATDSGTDGALIDAGVDSGNDAGVTDAKTDATEADIGVDGGYFDVGQDTGVYPAPIIESITPNSGRNNGTVNIDWLSGSYFRPGATVTLTMYGQPNIIATNIMVHSSTRISCTFDLTSKASGVWDIIVTNDDSKEAFLQAAFTIIYPAPMVSAITPNSGFNNDSVSITDLHGTYFRTGATVKLTKSGQSDIAATNVNIDNANQLTCTFDLIGQAAGLRNVVVTNDDAQSGMLPNGFAVIYPAPTVSAITPNSGLNNGSVSITDLHGTYFRTGATVKLTKSGQTDITATNVNIVNANRLTCTFDLTGVKVGQWNMVVTNDDARTGTLTNGFTVNNPAPAVTSIDPDSGDFTGHIDITNLAGTDFRPGATVKLSKIGEAAIIPGTNLVVVSGTKITCTFDLTGKNLGQWDVVVTNDDTQTGTLSSGFTVLNQCAGINDFSACTLTSATYQYNICIDELCKMPGCGDVTCNQPGPNFKLPPAGSPGLNYTRDITVAGQPVVTDNTTKLMWQGCAAGLSGDNCATGTVANKNWADALGYCNTLDWGGHTDWRLPGREELQSIVDYSKISAAIDTTAFPATPTSWFWSSSSYADATDDVWLVKFSDGYVSISYKTNIIRVRCVRSGS
jgi:hypothetical protein